MTVRGSRKEASGPRAWTDEARDDENAPLHSPKLTQRRALPAVVNSTPAGERKRPRVRRSHEENIRGVVLLIPTVCLKYRYCVSHFGCNGSSSVVKVASSLIRYADFGQLSSSRWVSCGVRGQISKRAGIKCHRQKAVAPQLVRIQSTVVRDLPGAPCVHRSVPSSP